MKSTAWGAAITIAAWIGTVQGAWAAAPVAAWGCYDPQPGHPTAAEREAFVMEVSKLATAAEAKHGVPAPAIAAMAIIESGYGFTRTSLNANNLFGYKSISTPAPGGREVYVLACQPASDPNNKYVKFVSRADAVDFVAGRLANSDHYAADTRAFAAARGPRRVDAVRTWVVGIADPYNGDPPTYARNVVRLMNDPITPSDTPNPQRSLFALGGAGNAGAAAPAATIAQSATAAARAYLDDKNKYGQINLPAARYMSPENGCKVVDPTWADAHPGFEPYAGLGVQRCEYSVSQKATATRPDVTLRAVVWLLNPSADQISRWVGETCEDLAATVPEVCGRQVAQMIIHQNGAQFPAAGHVVETQWEAGCAHDDPDCLDNVLIYLPQRHGLTVKMKTDPEKRVRTSWGSARALDFTAAGVAADSTFGEVASYGTYGRVANVDRDGEDGRAFVERNRDGYLAALAGGRYPMLTQAARTHCLEKTKKGSWVRDCGIPR
jgi:hypothetical protein